MSKQTENNILTVSSLPRLYQQLLKGMIGFQDLGNQVLEHVKGAQAFRQTDQVEELSKVLISIPIKEYQLIGQYYLAWCSCRMGSSQAVTLERIAEQSQAYKAQALLSRAAIDGYEGDIDSELYFYAEALKTRPRLTEYIRASIAIAVIKSKEGSHKEALKDLQDIIPLIKYVEPILYYDFLNSYAVELGEAGRIYEARNVCDIVLASPFAFAYPEWHATAEDLKGASRSRVAVNQSLVSEANLFHLPAVEHGSLPEPAQPGALASVISLPDWKKRIVKESEGDHNDRDTSEQVTDMDLCFRLIGLIAKKRLTNKQIYHVIEFVENLPAMSDSDAEQD